MQHVEIPTRDYAVEKVKSVAALRAEAAKEGARSVEREVGQGLRDDPALDADALRASLIEERDRHALEIVDLADATEANPVPVVKRHENVLIQHRSKRDFGAIHEFTASFDEVQRLLSCPTCGVEVEIPEQYRGTP